MWKSLSRGWCRWERGDRGAGLGVVTVAEAGPAVPVGLLPGLGELRVPHTRCWSLLADPAIGHRASAPLPQLDYIPSLEEAVGTTSRPGTLPAPLCRGAWPRSWLGPGVSGAWEEEGAACEPQRWVGPTGPPRGTWERREQR